MGVFGPYSSGQSSRHPHQIDHNVYNRHNLSNDPTVKLVRRDLVNSRKQHIEVNRRSQVTRAKREQGQYHRKVQLHILVHKTVARLLGIEIVIFEDVQKSEKRTIDPTTTLLHQIFVILHRVSLGNRIGNISQVILLLRLTVNSQGKNAILSEVHVGLAVVLLL